MCISTSESYDVVNKFKDMSDKITCGVSINNLKLNENDIAAYRTFLKSSHPSFRE